LTSLGRKGGGKPLVAARQEEWTSSGEKNGENSTTTTLPVREERKEERGGGGSTFDFIADREEPGQKEKKGDRYPSYHLQVKGRSGEISPASTRMREEWPLHCMHKDGVFWEKKREEEPN